MLRLMDGESLVMGPPDEAGANARGDSSELGNSEADSNSLRLQVCANQSHGEVSGGSQGVDTQQRVLENSSPHGIGHWFHGFQRR